MRIQLSAPGKAGHKSIHEDWASVAAAAARLLDCGECDLVVRESPDGGTTYYYASEAEADSDWDGAYAVQAREMPRYVVRSIRDAEMTWARLGPVEDERYHSREDACRAAGQLGQWGGVVIDLEAGTCDWGHAVVPVGQDAPPVAALEMQS